MIFWTLLIGVGGFVLMMIFIPRGSMTGASKIIFTIFPYIWLVFALCIDVVFIFLAIRKSWGAGKARRIRRHGKPGVGYLTYMGVHRIYYNGPIVNDHKVSFVFRRFNSSKEFDGETNQLVSTFLYSDLENRYWTNKLVPIRILNGEAVLDNKAISKYQPVSMSKSEPKKEVVKELPKKEEPKQAVNKVEEKPVVKEEEPLVLKELSEEDKKYINDLAMAYFVSDKKKIEELGFSRFNNLSKEFDTAKMKYIKGKYLLSVAKEEAKGKQGLKFLAEALKESLDPMIALDLAVLFDRGTCPYLPIKKELALRLYITCLQQAVSYSGTKALLTLLNNNPDIISNNDYNTFIYSYICISRLAADKKDKDAYYYLYKHADKYFVENNKHFGKFTKEQLTVLKTTFLASAEQYGMKIEEGLLPSQRVCFSEQEIIDAAKVTHNAYQNIFIKDVYNNPDKLKTLGEAYYKLIERNIK